MFFNRLVGASEANQGEMVRKIQGNLWQSSQGTLFWMVAPDLSQSSQGVYFFRNGWTVHGSDGSRFYSLDNAEPSPLPHTAPTPDVTPFPQEVGKAIVLLALLVIVGLWVGRG